VDEDGDPIQNMQGGGRPLPVLPAAARETGRRGLRPTTNDLGEYRIFNLPPGKYFMKAQRQPAAPSGCGPDDVENVTYAPVFYPGVAEPNSGAQLENWAGSADERDEPERCVRSTTPPFVAAVVAACRKPAIQVGLLIAMDGGQ